MSSYGPHAGLNKLEGFQGQLALLLVFTFSSDGIEVLGFAQRLLMTFDDESNGSPLQSSAAQSYLTELWLTQSPSIHQHSVPFLELDGLCCFFFPLHSPTAKQGAARYLPWGTIAECQCQSLPQRGRPSFAVAEHACTQSEGAFPALVRLASWGFMPCVYSEGSLNCLQLQTVLFISTSAAYLRPVQVGLTSCLGIARPSIGTLQWDLGGSLPGWREG